MYTQLAQGCLWNPDVRKQYVFVLLWIHEKIVEPRHAIFTSHTGQHVLFFLIVNNYAAMVCIIGTSAYYRMLSLPDYLVTDFDGTIRWPVMTEPN